MGFNNNVVYDNEVLENRIADILETGLDSMSFMTVDRDLEQNAGMKKVIHTYTYEGAVEAVAEGQATTEKAKLTFEEKEYTPSGADAWIKYWNNEDDDVEIDEVLNPPLNVIETTIDEDGNIVTTNKTMGALITNGKFNTVCPDCLFKYEWVKETYNDVIVNDDGTTTSQTKTGWSKVTKSYSDMFLRTIKKDNNTLIFKCPICNKTYDMSLRYDMLNYHIDSKIKKTFT